MRQVIVNNLTRPEVQLVYALYCEGFLCKLRGLILVPPLQFNKGIVLVYSEDSRLNTAIHMLGVLSDLAIAWINHDFLVVDVKLARRSKLIYVSRYPACFVLEMNPSRVRDFQPLDQLKFENL